LILKKRVFTAIDINGVKGIPDDNNTLYGLAMLEYPGIGNNIAQTGSAVLQLYAGDKLSLLSSMFIGVVGTYQLFATRFQIIKIFFQ